MKLTNKVQVKKYMAGFLHTCSFFGYTKNIDVELIAQVLRRLYKCPSEMPQEQLLNFLVMLAISKDFYVDFDVKSKNWIEEAITFIDNEYTGTKYFYLETPGETEGQTQHQKLICLKPVLTEAKVYNKQLVINVVQENKEDIEGESEEEIEDFASPASPE